MKAAFDARRALDCASDIVLPVSLFAAFAFQHTAVSTAGMGLLLVLAAVRFAVRPRIYGSVFFLGYALLIAESLLVALSGAALDRATSLAMTRTMCVGLGYTVVLVQLIVQRQNAEAVLRAYLLASLAFAAYMLLRERGTLTLMRLGDGSGISANDIAMILSVGCGIVVHRLYTRKRAVEALPLLFLAGVILLTGSRKGLAMLFVMPAAYLLLADRRHRARNAAVLFGLLLLLVAAIRFVPPLYERIGMRFVQLFASLKSGDLSLETSFGERLGLLRKGWEMFLSRPLSGWGFDCFRFNGVTRETYTHSNYLELLVSGGVFALLLYYVPLLAALVRGLRRGRGQGAVCAVAAVMLGQLLAESLLVSYYERPQLTAVALALGVMRLAGGDEADGTALLRYLKNPNRLFLPLAMRGAFSRMDDAAYLTRMYRAVFGKTPDLLHPRTMNEKLNHLKLYDRDPRYVTLADKHAVREYVAGQAGEAALVPLLGVWERVEDIDFAALPHCVLKVTNDSGGVLRWQSGGSVRAAKRFLTKHLRRDYAALWREWPYREVPPRVIAEAFVGGADGMPPVDYKLQCFAGRVFCLIVCTGRAAGKPHYWYFDRAGKPLIVTHWMEAHPKPEIALPARMEEMIALAEALSAPYTQLRVDLFDTADGIKVSELTLFDGAGFFEDYTEAGDRLLGEALRLPAERGEA